MTKKTNEQDGPDARAGGTPGTDAESGEAAPHPLDEWLRRELDSLFSAEKDDPLPQDMADLAGKLERALAAPQVRKRPG